MSNTNFEVQKAIFEALNLPSLTPELAATFMSIELRPNTPIEIQVRYNIRPEQIRKDGEGLISVLKKYHLTQVGETRED